MDDRKELEEIKKKINELDARYKDFSRTMFAYINVILRLLAEKEIIREEEFKELFLQYEKRYDQLMKDTEFSGMLKQFEKKDEPGQDNKKK